MANTLPASIPTQAARPSASRCCARCRPSREVSTSTEAEPANAAVAQGGVTGMRTGSVVPVSHRPAKRRAVRPHADATAERLMVMP
jgi:hypothetical protein